MKAYAVLLLASAVVQAAVIPPDSSTLEPRYEDKRQLLGYLEELLGKGGKVPDPSGAAPKVVQVKTNSTIPGVKSVKIRYGPYMVIGMNKTALNGEEGTLWNYPDINVQKPCSDCVLTQQTAGLEYPDGSNANIDTGLWLHHMVHLVVGKGRVDATCGSAKVSQPHLDIGQSPQNAERLFSSGNERTPVHYHPDDGSHAGYHVRKNDTFSFIVELMNENMEDKTVYMTMTYDYVDGFPQGWDDVHPIWFDVDQCGTSEVPAPQATGHFVLNSIPWTPNFEGKIIETAGHLHDGGTTVKINEGNTTACDSVASYGGSPAYIQPPGMGMGMGPTENSTTGATLQHISQMHMCTTETIGVNKLTQDQSWTIQGHYNYTQHLGEVENGKPMDVMTIAIMWVQVPMTARGLFSGYT